VIPSGADGLDGSRDDVAIGAGAGEHALAMPAKTARMPNFGSNIGVT
jgi:hypothetical protein